MQPITKIYKLLLTGVISLSVLHANAQQRTLEQTDIIKVPGITADTSIYNLTAAQKTTTKVYYDGLGRPVQQVVVKGSPTQKDIVQVMSYDNLGRQTTGYLPYAANDATGLYRPNAVTEQAAFYSNGLADKVADDSMPFSKQIIENSPLQRLLQAGSVGTGFQPGEHYSSVNYRSNNSTADGNIILWLPDGTRSGSYGDNLLSVTEGTNADGNKALVFTDKAGRTILKRQVLDATHQNDTYYIYNDAGAVSYVIPPKASKLLTDNGTYTLTQTGVAALIYKYTYDDKGRLMSKTIPGSGALYIIYDPLDRPVLMQDANLRFTNKWNFIKYDVQGRAIVQGYYTDATNLTQAAMQTYVDGMAASYATTWYEGRSTSAASGYYTNVVFPTTGITLLASSYYDNYDMNYDGTRAPDYFYSGQGLTGEGTATANTRGMLTMSRTRRVGSGLGDTWFTKVMFYDKRGNVIQVQSNNQLVSTTLSDVATSVPDFTGVTQIAKVVKTHGTGLTTTVLSSYSYDHMLRVTEVKQKYNADTEKTVATYEYNELGQLIDKKLGVNGAAFLQSVDYRYNIRGQLLSINNSTLTDDRLTANTNDDTNDVFGEELSYNINNTQVGSTGTYSGQLTAVKWMSLDGANVKSNERSYKYTYDGLNRFTQAIYAERLSTATPATNFMLNANGFTEKVTAYDENGNIQALQRYSSTVGGSGGTKIDGLKYIYDANNLNKLLTVTDSTANNIGFRNYTGSTGNYTYNTWGNLESDPGKGITAIAYNVLNRVDKVTLTYPSATGRYIDYTYDASGKLLRKRQYDNSILQKTTDYIDGFVYTTIGAGAAQLDYFGMPEGRVRNTGGATITLKQEFIITDHQGNARVSFEDNGTGTAKVVQENSYYAYGMSMTSTMSLPTAPNKNLYNGGSEWQNDYQDQPDWQQTFYRNYDQTIGRFLAVDPMAEATGDMSVYQYGNNNPVMNNDPLGNLSAAYGRILQQIEGADRYRGRESLGWADETQDRFQMESNMDMMMYMYYWAPRGAIGRSIATSIYNRSDGSLTQKMANLVSSIATGEISISTKAQVGDLVQSIRSPEAFAQKLQNSINTALIGAGVKADSYDNLMVGRILQVVNITDRKSDQIGDIPEDLAMGADGLGLAADFHGVSLATAKLATKDASVALKMLSRSGTVIGAIAGGAPAAYNIIKDMYNGGIGNTHAKDWINLGLATGGVAVEFFGIGEAWDFVGAGITGVTAGVDIYNSFHSKPHN